MNFAFKTTLAAAVVIPAALASASIGIGENRVATGHAEKVSIADRQAVQPVEKFAGFTHKAPRAESALSVDFTAGDGSSEPVKVFNFDDGFQGWTPDQAENVTWTVKETSGDRSFAGINPSSAKSLYVDGPYQIFKRETSSIISPSVTVPARGTLSFYAGFTLNYSDVCSLSLSVSEDGFNTETELWNSVDQQGERPFEWRLINLDLASFEGKTLQFKLTYGPGTDDLFKTGGYLGDFYIDDFTISGRKTIENVSLVTGERIKLVPLVADGEAMTYKWTMPGATPSESEEESPEVYYTADGEYDITLTVTDASGAEASKTRAGFAMVTGTEPVAKIMPPATFRYSSTRLPMVAPMLPVTWMDASEGYPTAWNWSFTGADPDSETVVSSDEPNPTVRYDYLHNQTATLEVSNQHGKAETSREISVEYYGVVNNLEPNDVITTFDMEDWGYFPGSNTQKITAYAEKFSKPSRPMVINGVYAYFTRTDAGQLVDQIASVGVHVCKSENGLPGQKLESWWWDVIDLDGPSAGGDIVGTAFPITPPVVVDDEFFIMIDGIPTYKEADSENGVTAVTLGMAAFRAHGNTAYMLKDGEWVDVSTYFPAGANHTSLMLYPSVIHSVIAPLPYSEEPIEVDHNAGSIEYPIFSIMGWDENVESDAAWLRVTNKPGDMTVDNLQIAYDALPENIEEREGNLNVTDGVTSMNVKVIQKKKGSSAIDCLLELSGQGNDGIVKVYNMQGVLVGTYINSGDREDLDSLSLPSGVYILRTAGEVRKVVMP